MVHFLKVGISEANEHLFHRLFGEIGMEGFHRVSSHGSHVQALSVSTVYSQSVRFFSHKVSYFVPNLLSQDQVVWVVLGESEHKASISTPYIENSWS